MKTILREIYRGRGSSAAALQSLFTKVLILGLNAITGLIVARGLGPEGRGQMSALIVWSGFLGGMLTCGLPAAMIFSLRSRRQDRSRIIGAGLVLTLGLSIAVALAGFIALPFWLTNYSAHDIMLARWFLLGSPMPLFLLIGRSAMEASGKFSYSNFALWSGPFLTVAFLAGLSLGGVLNPVTGGLAYVLGNVPSVLWLILRVWRQYRPQLSRFASTSKNLLHYGLRSWGVDLLNALGGQADQVLIIRFLSPASMGTYVVAASFARLIGVFHGSAVMVLFPRVADQSKSEIMLLTGLAARISSACAAVSALCIGLAGPYLLGLLYGSAYVQEGTTVFRIILVTVVLGGATQILAQAFMASNRPGVVTVIQGIGVGIGVASMPMLILKFGVAGAALALLLSSAIRLTLTLLCFRTILNIPAPSLFPRRSDLAFVMARLRGLLAKPELAVV